MKARLFIPLVLMVLAPLALLAWLGSSLTRSERIRREAQLEELLDARLRDLDSRVGSVLSEREQRVLRLTESRLRPPYPGKSAKASSASLDDVVKQYRSASREYGFARRFFLLDASGTLAYPSPYDPDLSTDERLFLQRTRRIWLDQLVDFDREKTGVSNEMKRVKLPTLPTRNAPFTKQQVQQSQAVQPLAQQQRLVTQAKVATTDRGWHAWYWEDGLDLLFWHRTAGGYVVGAELNRSRLLADIIAALPETSAASDADTRIGLHDAAGKLLYSWGRYAPGDDETAQAEIPLRAPLASWTLRAHMSPEAVERAVGGGRAAWIGSFLAMGAVLAGLGLYFYRESTRAIREAGQRVSFVNQVSHELKTPLTNIRMYAELLAARVPEEDAKAQRQLGVVVSESERLSRLIGNVLTFAREQRGKLELRPREADPDEVIGGMLERLGPVLEQRGIHTEFVPAAGGAMRLDPDVLEQVLVNLAGNVEKYAASGKLMRVTSVREGQALVVTVEDRGPGIPRAKTEEVFVPFQRLGDKLTEGAAGTGIGLSIARSLARLHGGDLRLVDSDVGARFELRIRAVETEGAT